jgi:hypothetical protein
MEKPYGLSEITVLPMANRLLRSRCGDPGSFGLSHHRESYSKPFRIPPQASCWAQVCVVETAE